MTETMKPGDLPHDIYRIISNIPFLGGFTDDELRHIIACFERTTALTGESIIQRGEQPSHLYVIISGQVELHIVDQNTDIRKRTFGPGDHFGEVGMLALVNEAASFIALEDCELLAFPIRALNELRRGSPDLFGRVVLNLARDLARKVQYSDDLMLRG